jgi:hypothetical protein
LWLVEISTWNHTVAAFVKTAPDLHHYSRHNWLKKLGIVERMAARKPGQGVN